MVVSSARPDCVPALCTHRPSLLPIEWSGENLGFSFLPSLCKEAGERGELVQILSFRGRRSRNKVTVGEPAVGSLTLLMKKIVNIKVKVFIFKK